MPGLKLIVEIDDKGSIKKIDTLDGRFNKFKRNVTGGAPQIAAGFNKIGKGIRRITAPFARFAMIAQLAMAGLGVAAVMTGAKFEQSMANVASVASSEGQSIAETMTELTAIARHWGSQTAYSASEAAEGMYALASAGFKVKEIGSAIGGVLKYAGATASELGMAAEGTVQAIKMFGLAASDSNRVVNVFAASISNSMLNAERLKEALAQVGSTAASVGMNLEHTVGTLATLHNAGQMGAIAGTRLKNVLVQMAKPSAALRKLMDGITFTGENMAEVMGMLAEKGATAGQVYGAFGRIGGGAVLAMMKAGSKSMSDMTESITGTQKAFEMYEQQMDTVQNQFKVLKSGVEENMIAVFMELKDVLRSSIAYMISLVATVRPYIVGFVKTLSSWIMTNKDTVKSIAKAAVVAGGLFMVFGLIAKVVGVAIGVFQVFAGVVGVVKGAFIAMHLAALGPWGILVAVAAAAIGMLIYYMIKYRDDTKRIFMTVVNAIWDSFKWIANGAAWLGNTIVKAFETAWNWVADSAKWVGDKMREYFEAPVNWIIDKVKWMADKIGGAMDWMVPGWRDALSGLVDVVKDKVGDGVEAAVDKTKEIAGAVGGLSETVATTVAGAVAGASVATFEYAKDKTTELGNDIVDKAKEIKNQIEGAVAGLKTAGVGGAMYVPPPSPVASADQILAEQIAYENDLLYDQAAAREANASAVERQIEAERNAYDAIDKYFELYDHGHRMQVDAIFALENAYDTFYDSLWDKEMTWKERRQGAWMSWKKSFLKLQADMLKQMLFMQIKTLLISEHARRVASGKERLEYAKLGAIRAYTAMASVPIIGPVLGAIAAAAAFAFLMAFHEGGRIGYGNGERVILAQDDEFMIRRDSARSIGYANLDQMNATGKLPATGSGPMTVNFEVNANTKDDANAIAEMIEDKIVPILEDLTARRRYKTGVA